MTSINSNYNTDSINIRLDDTVRASLNNDCMTNRYDDRRGRARTETDRDSHDEYD